MTKRELKTVDKILTNKGLEYNQGLSVYEDYEITVSVCLDNDGSYYLVIYSENNNIDSLMFNDLYKFIRFVGKML